MHWLKNKKNQILLFLFSFIISVFLYNLNLYDFNNFIISIKDSFFAVSVPLSLFSFIGIFTKFQVWKIWLKISIYLSVIGFLVIYMSSPEPEFLLTERVVLSLIYWVIYSLISLGIIIYHSFKK